MGSSRERFRLLRFVGAVVLFLAGGCSAGSGEGRVSAVVFAPNCGLEGDTVEIRPTSFFAEEVNGFLNIHVRRGGELLDRSDGISLQIRDVSSVKTSSLGQPLPLAPRGAEATVTMTFFLNATCPIDFDRQPVVYSCETGAVTFDALYAPDVDASDTEISGRFQGVECVDPSDRESRRATVEGEFRFFFTRGRPAQRFP